MKSFSKISIVAFALFLGSAGFSAQNNTQNTLIELYNSAAKFQIQKQYDLAEARYQKILQLDPSFTQAKQNLALMYYNLAVKNQNAQNYQKSLSYAKKCIKLTPKDVELLKILAEDYSEIGDLQGAISAYKEITKIEPKSNNLHALAQFYVKMKDYKDAKTIYKTILAQNPKDEVAKNNLDFVQRQTEVLAIDDSFNNLKTSKNTPDEVYELLKTNPSIPTDVIPRAQMILDLIWSDPTGKILINNLIEKNIPINLIQGDLGDASSTTVEKNFMQGQSITYINIPIIHVSNFYNQKLSVYQRLYGLSAFVHEICHAYRSTQFPQETNSIEEELGATMIGINLANKVLMGEDLTQKQTQLYSEECLKAIYSDDHKNLPLYSNFKRNMESKGINFPYHQVYSNIAVMHEKLVEEGKISPVSNVEKR